MSPTSYQAAPPRTTTITDLLASVKSAERHPQPHKQKLTRYCKPCRPSSTFGSSSNEHPQPRYSSGPDSAPNPQNPGANPSSASSGPWEFPASTALADSPDLPAIAAPIPYPA